MVKRKKIFWKMTKREKQKMLWGYFFILPAIFGLLGFIIGPMIFSFIVSLMEWDIVAPMKWVGFQNYTDLFSNDDRYLKSLRITFYFALLNVPAVNIFAFFLASLLNLKIKGLSFFRTAFFIPSIIPLLASISLWLYIYSPTYGLLNQILDLFQLDPRNWIFDEQMVIPCFVIMYMWASGGTMVIYLAGLQGVPTHLYEAVEIDGGNRFHKFKNVTLPMMSPIIFFNAVLCFIGSMQVFTEAFVMTKGGPNDASQFYMLYLYTKAFQLQEMGVASAMAWILFILIAIITLLVFKSSRHWVYYENEVK